MLHFLLTTAVEFFLGMLVSAAFVLLFTIAYVGFNIIVKERSYDTTKDQ